MATENENLDSDDFRVGLRFTGEQATALLELRELLGLSDGPSVVRYLITRGQEALSDKLRVKRLMDKLEQQYGAQEMLEFMRDEGLVKPS